MYVVHGKMKCAVFSCGNQQGHADCRGILLFDLKHGSLITPYRTTIEVNGRPLVFEVDTGVSRTIISEAMWRTELQSDPLESGHVSPTTYTGDAVPVSGLGNLLI